MATVLNHKTVTVVEHRSAMAMKLGDFSQTAQHINLSHGHGSLLELHQVLADIAAQFSKELGL